MSLTMMFSIFQTMWRVARQTISKWCVFALRWARKKKLIFIWGIILFLFFATFLTLSLSLPFPAVFLSIKKLFVCFGVTAETWMAATETKWRNNQNRTKQQNEENNNTQQLTKWKETKINWINFPSIFRCEQFSTFAKLFHSPHKVKGKTISVRSQVVYFLTLAETDGFGGGAVRMDKRGHLPYYQICFAGFFFVANEFICSIKYCLFYFFSHFFCVLMILMHFCCSESFVSVHMTKMRRRHFMLIQFIVCSCQLGW